jgi:hypothetical protein
VNTKEAGVTAGLFRFQRMSLSNSSPGTLETSFVECRNAPLPG